MNDTEEWRQIEGYEKYEISNYGRVRILEHIDSKLRFYPTNFLHLREDKDGYYIVDLTKDSVKGTFRVARLVAYAFLGSNPLGKNQVNHKDTRKTNNYFENLEWTSGLENTHHAQRNGLLNPPKGSSHRWAKIGLETALQIKERAETTNISARKIAEEFNVGRSTVLRIINEETWHFNGSA